MVITNTNILCKGFERILATRSFKVTHYLKAAGPITPCLRLKLSSLCYRDLMGY